jgi:hypothetical protein
MFDTTLQAIRGACLDFVADPFYSSATECVRYYTDGLLVLEAGRVKALGDYQVLSHSQCSSHRISTWIFNLAGLH